jgi:hypothetical protein
MEKGEIMTSSSGTSEVESEEDHLSRNVHTGDVCIRNDLNKRVFMNKTGKNGSMDDWVEFREGPLSVREALSDIMKEFCRFSNRDIYLTLVGNRTSFDLAVLPLIKNIEKYCDSLDNFGKQEIVRSRLKTIKDILGL